MYTPNSFAATDIPESVAVMKQFSFATIVTAKDNVPHYDKAESVPTWNYIAVHAYGTDLQGSKKLSQNKTEQEQKRIIETLSESSESTERQIAEYMRGNQSKIS